MKQNMKIQILICWVCMFFVIGHFNSIHAETIYSENFENGLGDWDNGEGIWQVGEAESGQGACYDGSNCSATVLNGKYDAYKDSRFKSPSIRLPAVMENEEIYLRFWHWFSYSSHDKAYVQVREYDDETKQWNEWVTISDSIHQDSVVWSPIKLDLSSRAGKKIQFCLYHIAGRNSLGYSSESTGWYVDNIKIELKTSDINWRMNNFESGWEDFLCNRGIWEIGSPESSPGKCYSGNQCAGTNLKGNYAAYTDSLLISSVLKVPVVYGDQEAKIRFWHWFSYSSHDSGIIKIKIFDNENNKWSGWTDISESITGNSSIWVKKNP